MAIDWASGKACSGTVLWNVIYAAARRSSARPIRPWGRGQTADCARIAKNKNHSGKSRGTRGKWTRPRTAKWVFSIDEGDENIAATRANQLSNFGAPALERKHAHPSKGILVGGLSGDLRLG